jgi:uncharacterized protein DUF6879
MSSLTVPPDLSAAVISPGSLDTWIRRRCQRTLFHLTSQGDSYGTWATPLPDRTVRRLCLLHHGQNGATSCPTRATALAHEEVRCLDRRRQPCPLEGVDQDFLIVDDRWVIRLLYDDHHRPAIGLIETAAATDRYRFVRDVFWCAAAT